MPKFTGPLAKYPARATFLWFAVLVTVGALTLWSSICGTADRPPISFLDALFTSTSAACVTGLTVRSTAHDFSLWGQVVILLLIQIGGIGIITVTTFLTLQLGGRQSMRARAVLNETLGAQSEGHDLRRVLRHVFRATLIIEAVGAAVLFVRNLFDMSVGEAAWHAVFHSVAAFCNAGFALFDDNLVRYQSDWIVNLTIMVLVIVGGIGFPVLADLRRHPELPWRERYDHLQMHSKLMLLGTALLISLGTVLTLIIEWDDSFQSMAWYNAILCALMHSVTCRTAGFNTIDVAGLTNATLGISILLMCIGAGPCSTAGGFKVSTFMTLAARAWSTFRGEFRVNIFRRTIPAEAIDRAVATAALFAIVALSGFTALLFIEQSQGGQPETKGIFLEAMFEVVSALGTVGLSTGFTTRLSELGRIVIIILMFVGRVGPISVFAALSQGERRQRVEYANEEPLIG